MRFLDYLKDNVVFLVINFVIFLIIASLMLIAKVGGAIIFLVFVIWFIPLFSYIILEFIKHKKYYAETINTLEGLDKKYLLPEVINEPNFTEGKLVYKIIREISRDMHENVKYYRDMQTEYREYIETWVHEIKTPIASTKLIIGNNNNEVTKRIDIQIDRVEGFIEQVLYYSRSNDVDKDYIINKFSLQTAVMKVVKRNSRDFITKKIKIDIKNIDYIVHSDVKWVEYIINQVIGNAIKYSKEMDAIICIYSTENENSVTLTIEDNGVGIIDRDINRVFEKGFTGENGRRFGKATGMGLYLCKKLCSKLGLGISLESKVNKGTKVNIIFPLGRLTNL